MPMRVAWMTAIVCFVLTGCGGGQAPAGDGLEREEPDRIVVQHILIGFAGSVPGKDIERSAEEAGELAKALFERAKAGEDFDVLVEEYTDDSFPGVYEIANYGAAADASQLVYARDKMVPAFGNVGFRLGVGEVGLAAYDPDSSKYGWHIIKRLE